MATVNHLAPAPGVGGLSAIAPEREEPTVPTWCTGLMEGSLWLAILVTVFLSQTPAAEAARGICVGFIALCALMWALHWYHLRRSTILLSWPLGLFVAPLLVIYLLALILGFKGLSLIGNGASLVQAVLCALVFVIVSGAFTERQVARLCAFLGGVGVLEALVALRLLGLSGHHYPSQKPFLFWEGEAAARASGTLGTEWTLGALLLCCLLGAATFAAYAIAAGAPSRDEVSFRSRTSWVASRGASMAFIAVAGIAVMMVLLFLVESILIVPLCVISLVLFFLLLGLKRRMGLVSVAAAIAVCLAFGLASLARPRDVKWGLSGTVLQSNLRSMLSGEDTRATESAAPSEGQPRSPIRVRSGDLAQIGQRTVWLVPVLLVGLVVSLVVTSVRGMAQFRENQPILAAGALATVVGVTLFAVLGHCLHGLGVALAVSAVSAIAAAGGDFEQELEEP